MKKLLLTAVCLLTMAAGAWADQRQAVTIDGQTVTKTATRLTFGDDGDIVVVHFADGTSQSADMERVELTFDWHVATAIDVLPLTPVTVLGDGDCYDLNGRKVNPSTLAKGVYILRQGRQTVKYVKR